MIVLSKSSDTFPYWWVLRYKVSHVECERPEVCALSEGNNRPSLLEGSSQNHFCYRVHGKPASGGEQIHLRMMGAAEDSKINAQMNGIYARLFWRCSSRSSLEWHCFSVTQIRKKVQFRCLTYNSASWPVESDVTNNTITMIPALLFVSNFSLQRVYSGTLEYRTYSVSWSHSYCISQRGDMEWNPVMCHS